MGYQIDIDVNSDQLELINDALNTTFNSFRATIDKLDRTIARDGAMRAAVDKNFPNYDAVKKTVAAEDTVIKEFVKSGSFKFLGETLLSVSRDLEAMTKMAQSSGAGVFNQGYKDGIKNLSILSKEIGRDSVAKREPKYPASSSTPFEGADYLSKELQSLIRFKNKTVASFTKDMESFPDLDTPNFKNFKKEVIALNATIGVYKATGNTELLLGALKRSDSSKVEESYRTVTGKSLPLTESSYRSEIELKRYLESKATVRDGVVRNLDKVMGGGERPKNVEKEPAKTEPVKVAVQEVAPVVSEPKKPSDLDVITAKKVPQVKPEIATVVPDQGRVEFNKSVQELVKTLRQHIEELGDFGDTTHSYKADSISSLLGVTESVLNEPQPEINQVESLFSRFNVIFDSLDERKDQLLGGELDEGYELLKLKAQRLMLEIEDAIGGAIEVVEVAAEETPAKVEEVKSKEKSPTETKKVPAKPPTEVLDYSETIAPQRRRVKFPLPEAAPSDPDPLANQRVVPMLPASAVKELLAKSDNSKPQTKVPSDLSWISVDIESIIAPPFQGLEDEVNKLAASIAKTRSVIDLPIVERTDNPEEFRLKSGDLQFEAYKRAMKLNQDLPDRMTVLDGGTVSDLDLYLKQEMARIQSKVPYTNPNLSFDKTAAELPALSLEKRKVDSLNYLADIENIDITRSIKGFEDEIDYLARIIVKTRKLIEPIVLADKGDGLKLVSNPLPLQAYKRAMEIDPTLSDKVPMLLSKRDTIAENRRQEKMLRSTLPADDRLRVEPVAQVSEVVSKVEAAVESVKKVADDIEENQKQIAGFADLPLDQLFSETERIGNKYQSKEEVQSFYDQMAVVSQEVEDLIDKAFVDVEDIIVETEKKYTPVARKVPTAAKSKFEDTLRRAKERGEAARKAKEAEAAKETVVPESGGALVYSPGGEIQGSGLSQAIAKLSAVISGLTPLSSQIVKSEGGEIQGRRENPTPIYDFDVEAIETPMLGAKGAIVKVVSSLDILDSMINGLVSAGVDLTMTLRRANPQQRRLPGSDQKLLSAGSDRPSRGGELTDPSKGELSNLSQSIIKLSMILSSSDIKRGSEPALPMDQFLSKIDQLLPNNATKSDDYPVYSLDGTAQLSSLDQFLAELDSNMVVQLSSLDQFLAELDADMFKQESSSAKKNDLDSLFMSAFSTPIQSVKGELVKVSKSLEEFKKVIDLSSTLVKAGQNSAGAIIQKMSPAMEFDYDAVVIPPPPSVHNPVDQKRLTGSDQQPLDFSPAGALVLSQKGEITPLQGSSLAILNETISKLRSLTTPSDTGTSTSYDFDVDAIEPRFPGVTGAIEKITESLKALGNIVRDKIIDASEAVESVISKISSAGSGLLRSILRKDKPGESSPSAVDSPEPVMELEGSSTRALAGSEQQPVILKPYDAVNFPVPPSEHNPFHYSRSRILELSADLESWGQKALPPFRMPPPPSVHNPFTSVGNKLRQLLGQVENWDDIGVIDMPPAPSSHNPKEVIKVIDLLKERFKWFDMDIAAFPPVPSTHNPYKPPAPSTHNPYQASAPYDHNESTKRSWLENGVLRMETGGGGSTPPPPRKPPTPPSAPDPDENEPNRKKKKSDNEIFREARDKLEAIKDQILQAGIGNVGSYRVSKADLFPSDQPKNAEKAQVLVNTANRWIEKNIKIFENAALADARVAAKLGDNRIADLSSSDAAQARKIQLAQQKAEEDRKKREGKPLADAKKEESESFNAYRRQLEARLKAAMNDTTSNQEQLIKTAIEKIRQTRSYIEGNSSQFLDKNRFGKDGSEVYRLQMLENQGVRKLESVKNKANKEDTVETTNLQEMRAGMASIRTFFQDLQAFTTGLIQVSSAINKEVIKLGVANNNSISKTEKDIADSSAIAKKFGGSTASYLKDFANIKIADLSQVSQSGSFTPNRFLDSEVKSLVAGLRSAYNVNQLDREAQDGASKAITQMLSKGKIQAEELRGQLGDRLNGAVTLFAQALGISTAQLDRRLKEGSVMDVEVFKFGRLLERKYSAAAQLPTLIKETTNLSGSVSDIATQAAQPIAGVTTVAAQFLNSLTDGIKANAATMSIAMIPIGAALATGVSGGIRSAFMKSSFSSPIIAGLGESLKANMKTIGVLGGGLGVAAIGTSMFGSDGLDKTILKLGDQLKNLVGVIGGAFSGLQEKGKESGIGKSDLGKIAFEVLPLAALASPITNFAIDKTREMMESTAKKNAELGKTEGRKPSFGERVSNAASSLPLLNIGAAITAGVLAYSIANTRFVSEYTEITNQMIRELRKGKKDETSAEKKEKNFRKNEGTENPLSIDSTILGISDLVAAAKGDLKGMSLAGLKDAMSSDNKDWANAAKKIFDEKVKEGYTPQDNTYAGLAANNQIIAENAARGQITVELNAKMKPSYYKEELEKSGPIVEELRRESVRLLEMQNSGLVKQIDIDAQAVKVQTLSVKAREAMPDLLNAQADVAQRIAKLEELKQNVLAQDLVGAKEKAADYDKQIADLRVQLPRFTAMIQRASDMNQMISDRKIEISTREKKIGLERLKDSADQTLERDLSSRMRFGETNDDGVNLRESATATKAAQLNLTRLQEQLTLASEKRSLISQQTTSDTQQTEYEAALKAEAEVLNAANEGVLALTKARLDEKKAMEEVILNGYARVVRNFSSENANTDNIQSKEGLKKGILDQTYEFGTLSKAQFALNEYLKIVPSLTLSAGEVREKLRELSDQVVLSTLSFLEQQNQFTSARTIAEIDSALPRDILRDRFFDRNDGLQRNLEKAEVEQESNQYLTTQTRIAMDSVKDPEQKANLALKLINLETEAIKRKFDVEMASIELARAAYKRTMEVLQTQLNQISGRAQAGSQNRQFVEGRNLEERLSQVNQFGATLTENRQAIERLNTAVSVQNQNRATNRNAQAQLESSFFQSVPELPADYKQFISGRLRQSSAFQVNSDLNDLQARLELANNSGDPTMLVETQNLGKVNINVAEALVKLLTATAQIKQIDQSNSESVAQAQNALKLSTASVVRATRQQDSNNRLSQLDTKQEANNNQGLINTARGNARTQADAIRARNAGISPSFGSVLQGAEVEYNDQIRKAEAAVSSAEATRAALKKTQDELAFGATQVELDANAAILRGEDEKIKKARIQLRGVQIAGAERLLSTVAGFSSDLNNLFDTASSRLRESVDLLNRNLNIFRNQGLEGTKNPAVIDTIPEAYTDKNGVVRQREKMSRVEYDPNITGNYETAQLIAEMNKVDAEAKTRMALLEYVQKNLPQVQTGGVESTQQYKDVPELRAPLKEIEGLVLGTASLTEATNVLNTAMGNLRDSMFTDAERAEILNRKLTRDQNNMTIARADLEINSQQGEERRIAGTRGMTGVWRLLLGAEPQVQEIAAQRRRAKAEFDSSQLSSDSFERERGAVQFRDKTLELDDQLSKLPVYGNRLALAMEDAVANGSKLSAVLSNAITKGDWSMVLNDLMVNIFNSLGDKFLNDAGKGLGGLIGGGIQSLFGIGAKSSGDLRELTSGYTPSYASGNLPDGVVGKRGSSYPRTRTQDVREMSTSHLAIIGRDELVVPASEISTYIDFKRGIGASSNVMNSSNSSNSNTVHNTYSYSNYQGGNPDSFNRPEVYKKREEEARMNRFK